MFENFLKTFVTFPSFVLYFGVALLLTWVFSFIYTRVTPHDEYVLIRAGNKAATMSFIGSMLGFILPMSALIRVSANLMDMILWSILVLLIQLAVYFLCRWFLGRNPVDVADSAQSRSDSLFTAGTALGVGWIGMQCLHG